MESDLNVDLRLLSRRKMMSYFNLLQKFNNLNQSLSFIQMVECMEDKSKTQIRAKWWLEDIFGFKKAYLSKVHLFLVSNLC